MDNCLSRPSSNAGTIVSPTLRPKNSINLSTSDLAEFQLNITVGVFSFPNAPSNRLIRSNSSPSWQAHLVNVSFGPTLFGTPSAHNNQAQQASLAQQLLSAQQARSAQQMSQINSTLSFQVLFLFLLNSHSIWNMNTSASSHLNSHSSNLSTVYNNYLYPSVRVRVGDRKAIPVTNTGHSILPILSRPLYLHNVLVTPNIIKNLIFVRQFTRDNKCTIEFDEFGFSVKDFLTRHILIRCDSLGDLYPVTKSYPIPSAFLSISPTTWHQRLGQRAISFHAIKRSLHIFVTLANLASTSSSIQFETHANITLSDGLDPLVIGRTIQKAYETGMLENGDVVVEIGLFNYQIIRNRMDKKKIKAADDLKITR
ncbi:hypothetical protein Tco_1224987 [Tanacetum coccineum]